MRDRRELRKTKIACDPTPSIVLMRDACNSTMRFVIAVSPAAIVAECMTASYWRVRGSSEL
jgi:hypothetical protein